MRGDVSVSAFWLRGGVSLASRAARRLFQEGLRTLAEQRRVFGTRDVCLRLARRNRNKLLSR